MHIATNHLTFNPLISSNFRPQNARINTNISWKFVSYTMVDIPIDQMWTVKTVHLSKIKFFRSSILIFKIFWTFAVMKRGVNLSVDISWCVTELCPLHSQQWLPLPASTVIPQLSKPGSFTRFVPTPPILRAGLQWLIELARMKSRWNFACPQPWQSSGSLHTTDPLLPRTR